MKLMMIKPFENSWGKFWHNENGILHREDGPAIEYKDGTKHWYLNGIFYNVSSLDEFIIAQIIE